MLVCKLQSTDLLLYGQQSMHVCPDQQTLHAMHAYLNMGEKLLTQRGGRAMVSTRGRGLGLSHVH